MISLIFKALFLYILFLMVRGAWRGYKVYGAMQEALRNGQSPSGAGDIFGRAKTHSGHGRTRDTQSNDIIEAEYRVIDPKN